MRLIKGIAVGAAAVAAVGGAIVLGDGAVRDLALSEVANGARRDLTEATLNAALDASGAK